MSFDRLHISSPADLVTIVAYLLGFHPGDGNIAVTAHRRDRVVFVARADLPTPDAPSALIDGVARHLIDALRQQDTITEVVLIGYGPAAQVDPHLTTVRAAITGAGTTVARLLRVTDGRVFGVDCGNPDCCPPHGTPVDPHASAVAAHATVAGLVALPDRAALAALAEPVTGAARDAMHRATTAATLRLDDLLTSDSAAVDRVGVTTIRDALAHHDTGEPLTDDDTAWLTLLLTRTAVRDAAVYLTRPHDSHVTFWTGITRRAEPHLVAAPAVLLALAAWRCGNGGLAAMAVDRALHAEPGNRLAAMIRSALQVGLPPAFLEHALAEAPLPPGEHPTCAPPPAPDTGGPADRRIRP